MFKKKEIKLNIFFIKIFGLFLISNLIPIQATPISENAKITLDTTYLESKGELEDYILDTGDVLNIEFIDLPEMSQSVPIDQQGEIYLDRLNETYVRGLTINELENLLEQSYKKFLNLPEIKIRLIRFKSIKVYVGGELRNPGLKKFSGFTDINFSNELNAFDRIDQGLNINKSSGSFRNNQELNLNNNLSASSEISRDYFNRKTYFVSTISNAINEAGGLTSYSDITRIELVRDIPKGKGGGKKRTIIDFSDFLNNKNTDMDLRLFDGDSIYIPSSKVRNIKNLKKSILLGLTPKFINVLIKGKIENPGEVKIPVEGTLSDVMNISGPRKPLSGNIFLIRYSKDGSLIRKNIRYSANASAGTKNNPYLFEGDILSVKNSIFGRSTRILREVTQPIIGVYATKEIIEDF